MFYTPRERQFLPSKKAELYRTEELPRDRCESSYEGGREQRYLYM